MVGQEDRRIQRTGERSRDQPVQQRIGVTPPVGGHDHHRVGALRMGGARQLCGRGGPVVPADAQDRWQLDGRVRLSRLVWSGLRLRDGEGRPQRHGHQQACDEPDPCNAM